MLVIWVLRQHVLEPEILLKVVLNTITVTIGKKS